MTVDFQLSLLSYLVQCSEGQQYIDQLDDSLFDLVEDRLTFQLLVRYHKIYQSVPSQVVMIQYAEEQIAQTPNMSKEMIDNLRLNLKDIYVPLPEGDKLKIQDTLILDIQQKSLDKTFLDFASNKLSVNQVFTKVNKLSSLVKSASADYQSGGFLIQDRYKHFEEQVEGNPTFLHDLNTLTSAGGFYSPQLIVFMSAPKSFKTGLLLKLAIEYARSGMKVYYADNENSARSLRNRAKMAIMECTLSELYDSNIQEELEDTLYRFGHYMAGDLFIDEYPAYSKSMKDVKDRLLYLQEHFKWLPDIIIYDALDKFMPISAVDSKRDLRIRIQLIYDEAINLSKEFGTFAFAPSQVNRTAIGKKIFDLKDLSEDFAKSFNCHALFSVCMTPEEEQQGIRRIIPVIQREGVSYKGHNMCIIKVDEERGKVEEVDKDLYEKDLTDE
jgi:DnaB-like helicase C terminal domain.